MKSTCQPSDKSPHFTNCKWILELPSEVSNLKNFVVNHDLAHTHFQKHSDLGLLKVGETRFVSHYYDQPSLQSEIIFRENGHG